MTELTNQEWMDVVTDLEDRYSDLEDLFFELRDMTTDIFSTVNDFVKGYYDICETS